MLANVLVSLVGILFFLFIFWKRLKEDYSNEIIFRSAFLILAVLLLSIASGFKFLKTWMFFIEIAGIVAGILLSVAKFKVRFFETLEAVTAGLLPWLALYFLTDSVTALSLISFFGFLVILILIFGFYYMDVNYKNFSWYASGKIGFSGLATISLIFLLRFLVAIMGITVLSFVSRSYEAIISGSLLIMSLFGLYRLGRQSK